MGYDQPSLLINYQRPGHSAYKNFSHSIVVILIIVVVFVVVVLIIVIILYIGLGCNQPSLLIRALPSALSLAIQK